MKNILAIDIGTQSIGAALITPESGITAIS
jgi:RNase H-fold protein (predicted Holliday junction resolvase)